ncbi:MAG: hypothetical protein V3U54_13170 [Thermodesulfobacteriota bacterium]
MAKKLLDVGMELLKEPLDEKNQMRQIQDKKRDLSILESNKEPTLATQLRLEIDEQSWLRDQLRQTYIEIKFLEERQKIGKDKKGNIIYQFDSETTYDLLERRKLMGAIFKLWSGDRYRSRDLNEQLESIKERKLEDKLELIIELIIEWTLCENNCNRKLNVKIQEILRG